MSTNKMKQDISLSVLSDFFQKHSLGTIQRAELMTGGEFNSVWKVITDSLQKYVIKIAPQVNVKVLTYEHNLIQSEVYAYEKLARLKTVHVPKIYGYNWLNSEPYQYLIMEFIEGEMLWNAKLSQEEMNQVMYKLGQTMAEIHSIKDMTGFGYIQNGLKKTWRDAYLSMINNIINDGIAKKAKIPYLKEIQKLINQNLSILDEVDSPVFVHFDLWAGNIILNNNQLYAIIDCERAMFGDVMGEFISLDYITPFSVEKNKSLIEGYQSIANDKIEFNRNEMIRLYLMRLYLGLITNVEPYYRYSTLSVEFYRKYNFSKQYLKTTIKELKKYTNN